MFGEIGSVSKIFLIILILLVAIAVLTIPSFRIWRDIAKSGCIMEQISQLRSLEQAVKNAKETGSFNPKFRLKVMYCIDCIWFNTEKSSLMIKISGQDKLVEFPIESNFLGIGCDCSSCDQKSRGLFCANLRKDTTYALEIWEDYVNFTGYLDDEDVVHHEGFSSQPCQPCVGYDEKCGEIGSQNNKRIIPCCVGSECKSKPHPLMHVNWLGKEIGESSASWNEKKCLKSLGQECNDYTECSIFTSQAGSKAQYPCNTSGVEYEFGECKGIPFECEVYSGDNNGDGYVNMDDVSNCTEACEDGNPWKPGPDGEYQTLDDECDGVPRPCSSYDEQTLCENHGCTWEWKLKKRCCSPLLSKAQTGEGSRDDPASYCTGYGGCEVYCGNVTCGHVYDIPEGSTEWKKMEMCCKPLGEECWYQNWKCCANQKLIDGLGPPTACWDFFENKPCSEDSKNCRCCISLGYNCTYETRDDCCGLLSCKDLNGGSCDKGEECKCS